jgi:hypothetical protein
VIRVCAGAVLLLLAFATSANAADIVLAPASETAGLTAYAGDVVFSRHDPTTGRWALMRWHAGVINVLPVAQRIVPFDADAGSDAAGRPVVVYSRCAHEDSSLVPDWEVARGCDVYELALTGRPVEHKLAAASSKTASETTPSMWRGALAFVRHADRGIVPRILYLRAGTRTPRTLGGGSVQTCAGACGFSRRHDTVERLDLGESRVAYVWRMTGGSVYGTGIVYELRAAPLAGGPSTLLDTGLFSGTCGYGLPNAPTMSAGTISYVDSGADCDVITTQFASADPVTGARGTAPTPGGLADSAVTDAGTIYWLRIPPGAPGGSVPGNAHCARPGVHCELVASPVPAYNDSQRPRPQSPPGDIDLVRSGTGYRWVRGPAGTRLLRPPRVVPCAPSAYATYVYASARWKHGHHRVSVLRQDPRGSARPIAAALTRSQPTGVNVQTRLMRCGTRTRLTYVVKTGTSTRRVSFDVTRAARR